jgi:outer membrane protein TolC
MRTILVVALMLCTQPVWAQDGEKMSMSLPEAQEYAIKNSFLSKSARIDIAQADQQVWEQAAKGLPQVSGSFNYTDFIDLPTSLIPATAFGAPEGTPPIAAKFGQKYVAKAGLNASQLLFDGSYIIGLKGAKGVQLLRDQQGQMVDQDVRTMIEESYYTALVARENTERLKASAETVKRTLKETQALFLSGFTEEMNVDQLTLMVNGLETQIEMAERQSRATIDLLKYQMGMPMETELTLTDDMEAIWRSSDPDALLRTDFDVTKNVVHQMNKLDVKLHGYLVKLQEARYYPSLSAMFNHEQQAFRNTWNFFDSKQSWYPQTLWGVSLHVPIWDNLGARASIKKAKLEQQRVADRLTYVEQGLKLKYRTSKDNFISATERLNDYKADMDLATRIRDKTLLKYTEGVATSMEVTTAENQLLASQTTYINGLFAVLEAKAELSKVLLGNE